MVKASTEFVQDGSVQKQAQSAGLKQHTTRRGGAYMQKQQRLELFCNFSKSHLLPYGLWEKSFIYRLINLIMTGQQAVSICKQHTDRIQSEK